VESDEDFNVCVAGDASFSPGMVSGAALSRAALADVGNVGKRSGREWERPSDAPLPTTPTPTIESCCGTDIAKDGEEDGAEDDDDVMSGLVNRPPPKVDAGEGRNPPPFDASSTVVIPANDWKRRGNKR